MDNIEACRRENKLGLHFIDKYPDSHKIVYSDLSLSQIKDLKIKLFKGINHKEEKVQQQMMQEEEKKEDGGPNFGAPKKVDVVQNSLLREI